MKVFALGDLHLSFANPKPMEIFGEAWRDHPGVIAGNWRAVVGPEDVVIVPGDTSWAMKLPDARPDLAWLGDRPGTKVLVKGNHDYWWASVSQVRAALHPSVRALQGEPVVIGNLAVAGTRGWVCPGAVAGAEGVEGGFTAEDEKIHQREVQRLEASLAGLKRLSWERLVVALHYPPWNENQEPSGFSRLIEAFPGCVCVYGHLHGPSIAGAFQGERNGVTYLLASADAAGFSPVEIPFEKK